MRWWFAMGTLAAATFAADAGKVGVWIEADSVSYFSDLSAEELK